MANSLYDALFMPHASNDADFLICDDGRVLSYRAFVARAAQMAGALVELGVGPGDCVMAQTPKTAETVALYAGCVQAGAVYLPLNTAYTQEELRYFIGDAKPKVLVCEAHRVDEVRACALDGGAHVLTMASDGSGTLADAADAAATDFATVPRREGDLAALLYTSGTTGRSKGAMMSHRNLLSNAATLTELWRITADDRLVHALPIFHTHGLFVALNTSLLAGAQVRLMSRFDVDTVMTELRCATLMMGVPTFYNRLLEQPSFGQETCAHMRLFISGSAPLLADTHDSFAARSGHRILERYGMTETNMITSNPYDGERIAGTVGYALPDLEVRITADGQAVPAGEIGVIEVRGPNVFQGYLNMPEKTREEFREDGFFVTGDLGVMDEDGRVNIVGRQKDLIISGGYNVYPKEVEDVLNAMDGVKESAVFGCPDRDLGERVVAAIVPDTDGLESSELEQSVAQSLARFKQPKAYHILDALPRNAMGKVQKNVLRDSYG